MMKQLEAVFGIKVVEAKNLDGDINYTNKKFKITDSNGIPYILKIFPDPTEWILAAEESIVLDKIAGKLSFKVPQNIRQHNGDMFFAFEQDKAKLLAYIEGDFIADVPHTEKLLFALGEKIAELNCALQTVESPIWASRILFWDVQHTHLSQPKIAYIQEPERRKLVQYYIDRFINFVLPFQYTLRHSLIHGDLNDYNILVQGEEISGFIDFGDATYSPMVNDLAIALTYMMLNKDEPFEVIFPMIQGYQKHISLGAEELAILPDLITSRLCISLCNSAEKKHLGQDNAYVLVSEKPAWKLLELWAKTNPIKIKNYFLAAGQRQKAAGISNREEMSEIRKKVAGKSLGLSYAEPIQMTSALFQYMFDEKGNTYLDCYNNIPHIGHSHPNISKAIASQTRILNTNTRYLTDSFNRCSERLLNLFPKELSKVFYLNSGSEANDLAIRMARTVTHRDTVVVLENGYHGNTSVGIEISAYKFDGKGGKGVGADILKLPLPNLFQGKFKTAQEYANQAIELIEQLPQKPCAFIAEPISGCGGQVPLAGGYLAILYEYFKKNGILTISDEVQTGFGRLGKWYWGFEMHNVIPDFVVLGKPMGNGHPVAAVITTEHIAEQFANGMEFFSSFGGNQVSCEVVISVIETIERENLQANAYMVGEYFKNELLKLQNKYPAIADVRGEGLFLGVEFLNHKGQPDKLMANTVKNKLKEKFILTGTDGPFDNVIKIKPPICFHKENVDTFITAMDNILKYTNH
jgi:4-aminobutyrate aminotransferase-like enzyme/Ser/Thr protein kinase RdoA (MazF antagonist)